MTWYEELGVKNPYYADDAVALIHADCREVLPTLGRFDLLLTDPPYGIGFAAQPTKWQRAAGKTAKDWDNETVSLDMVLGLAEKSIIWGGNYYLLPPSRGWLVWYKPDSPPSMSHVELAWTSMDMNASIFNRSISSTNAERVGHPTQKPLALMAWCLSFAPDAVTVLDPFAGSGTTGRACKDLGRKCVLIEREEKYCEIAAKRMLQEVLF